MPIERVEIAEPFFGITVIRDAATHSFAGRQIVINAGDTPLRADRHRIDPLRSVIAQDTTLTNVDACILIDRFDAHADDASLLANLRQAWPSAFDVRGEDRLRGVEHYMSPKAFVGQIGLTVYHSASVPLNVGLHREHPFCPVPGFREVHTQIIGIGKMQQCREPSVDTLFAEEIMAPGTTHAPMFDEAGSYPWHQYETITPSVFLAVELLPEGAELPD